MEARWSTLGAALMAIPRIKTVETAAGVISFFLTVAAVNIGLGVVASLVYDRFLPRLDPVVSSPEALDDRPAMQIESDATVPPPTVPEPWRRITHDLGVEDAGLRESALWVLLHRTEELRNYLIDVELAVPSEDENTEVVEGAWTQYALQLASDLRDTADLLKGDDEVDSAGRSLTDSLLDYAVQFEEGAKSLTTSEPVNARRIMDHGRDVARRQLDLAFRVRDELEEWQAKELVHLDRVQSTPTQLCVDPRLSLCNRIGLEYVAQPFLRLAESRRVSLGLIDIDRFDRVNRQVGIQASDRMLTAIARFLDQRLREYPGFDRIVRLGGESFVFLLGNTPLDDAELACESARQSVEAASFRIGELELELTVSCAAVFIEPDEIIASALRRLQNALAEARRAGRNRTCVDTGDGLLVVQPKQLHVTGKLIEVSQSSVE